MNYKLKQARERQGLTQVEVAEKANMAIRSYQYIEAGERVPNVRTALLIAKALHTDVEKIFVIPSASTEGVTPRFPFGKD